MQIFYQKLIACFSDRNFIRLMRFPLVILLLIQFFFVASASNGQTILSTRISLDAENITLKQAFAKIEAKTNFTINYNASVLNTAKIVHLTVKDLPVETIIHHLLDGYKGVISQVDDTHILIKVIKQTEPPVRKPAQQQSGTVKGRIVEFETSEPLPGASVRIAELNKGTASDEKGFYHMDNIPPGTYTLEVSFVGYEVYRQPGMEIQKGKELTLDVKLKASNNLSEVVIKSRRGLSKQSVTSATDKDVLQEIRESTGVVSGISSEQIGKTPDRNAAEVVKRISGVSVVDERFIVVRGMNERYNLTYLNGNIAPTTELYTKAFAYDLLPSSIIDRILVYKSPQADLSGDFAGGAVKVYTKNTKPVRHLDIGVQLADRPGSTLTNVNSYKGGKLDFLGFDDGSRKLPSFSPSYFQSNQNTRVTDQSELLKGFSPTLDYNIKKSMPDMQFYANYYDNWKLGKVRLYDLTSINYTHETRSYDIREQTGNTYYYGLQQTATSVDLNANNQITNSQQTTEIGKINILENLTLKLDKNNQLEFKNFFVNEGRKLTTLNDSRRNVLPSVDSAVYGNQHQHSVNLSFQQRFLYSGNLAGTHDFQDKKQQLNWNLGYSYLQQNVPDQRNSTFVSGSSYAPGGGSIAGGSNVGSYDAGYLGMLSRLFIKLDETAYNASIDYTFHLNPQFTLQAGTYQLYKTREVGRRIFRVNRAGLQPDEVNFPPGEGESGGWIENYGQSNPNLIFFPQNQLGSVWSDKYFPNDGSGLAIYDVTSPVDSYVASEQNNAGYLMGDWTPFGKHLTVNAGLRMEYDRQQVAGATGDNMGAIYAVKVDHPVTSFLPSVNINYKPDTAYALRASYGRTVNRPDFRELTPYNDFDYQNNILIVGNPNLASATIDNFDLRAEFYPASAQQNEVFNMGVFYKAMQNPIEQERTSRNGLNDVSAFTDITYGNAINAKIYGIEAEVKKSLSFIPGGIFRRLSVVANGALVKSATQDRDYDSSGLPIAGTDLKGRPLQGQSPYVINAGLYYENVATGTKIGLNYNVSGARIYAKSTGNPNSKLQTGNDSIGLKSLRPDLLQLPQKLLDFSITQRIVKSLQMKFSIQNILNQAFTIVEDQNYNQKYDPEKPVKITTSGAPSYVLGKNYYVGDDIFQKYNPGRYFIVQFTYAF